MLGVQPAAPPGSGLGQVTQEVGQGLALSSVVRCRSAGHVCVCVCTYVCPMQACRLCTCVCICVCLCMHSEWVYIVSVHVHVCAWG